ncbi:hypothetical protein [Croceicoccus gelatinilyticus]|uniref:hypothetical protein n=1 Tax=Croceicoccus gelatinilyticus TaxID=2835536 RepID=UPI001BD163D7|nr:hypothetical protein [Croceicoccus gelatinilyticus]MBS7668923.1 hypothetical protein [Croceicoccus gelatinilyticus]
MWLTGGTIAAIRIVTLAMRFALTVYVTAMLGLVEVGQLGLVKGLTALVPAVLGMGFNFHMCRDVVSDDPASRIAIVRDRMAWTLRVSLCAAVLGLLGVWTLGGLGGGSGISPLLIVAILLAETLAMDAYLALTGLRMNVVANWGVLLRTAAWVPVAVIGGLLDAGLRTLDFVFACWLVGHVANFVMLGWVLRRLGLWHRWKSDPPTGWVRRTVPGAMRIWPSDVALVLITYGDRFILSATVGEETLGIYVFFWTFANMIRTLMQSAIVTPSLPRLIDLHRKDRGGWLKAVRQLGVAIPATGVAASAALLLFIWLGHNFVPQSNFPWQTGLAILVFAAVMAGYFGDYLSTVLNSAGAVGACASLNIGFAACLMLAIAAGAMLGGVIGATIASLVTALVFSGLKLAAIRRV